MPRFNVAGRCCRMRSTKFCPSARSSHGRRVPGAATSRRSSCQTWSSLLIRSSVMKSIHRRRCTPACGSWRHWRAASLHVHQYYGRANRSVGLLMNRWWRHDWNDVGPIAFQVVNDFGRASDVDRVAKLPGQFRRYASVSAFATTASRLRPSSFLTTVRNSSAAYNDPRTVMHEISSRSFWSALSFRAEATGRSPGGREAVYTAIASGDVNCLWPVRATYGSAKRRGVRAHRRCPDRHLDFPAQGDQLLSIAPIGVDWTSSVCFRPWLTRERMSQVSVPVTSATSRPSVQ